MPKLSINLLPSVAAEIDHTPKDVTGENYRGDGYYGFSDGLHTVAHYLIDFVGTLQVQGTLATDPVDTDWVTISTITKEIGDPITVSESYNFTGNFVWVRAVITNMTYGAISKVQMNH